jgi:hypothetical protein
MVGSLAATHSSFGSPIYSSCFLTHQNLCSPTLTNQKLYLNYPPVISFYWLNVLLLLVLNVVEKAVQLSLDCGQCHTVSVPMETGEICLLM